MVNKYIIFGQPNSSTFCFPEIKTIQNVDILDYQIPDNITIIGAGCLESLNINTLYSNKVETIGNSACKNTKIKKLFVNKYIKSIGERAFFSTGLNEIIFEPGSKITNFGNLSFGESSGNIDIFYSSQDYNSSTDFSANLNNSGVFSPGTNVIYHEIDNFTFIKDLEDVWVQVDNSSAILTREDIIQAIDESPVLTNFSDIREVRFNTNLTTISDECFKDCEYLNRLNLLGEPNLTTIGKSAFQNCISLKTLVLPDSIKIFSESCFEGCVNLSFISFSEGSCACDLNFHAKSFNDISNNVHVNFECISNQDLAQLQIDFQSVYTPKIPPAQPIRYTKFTVNHPEY